MNVGDRVRVRGYALTGKICRIERKWKRDGAHVHFDGKQFTDWYPLDQLEVVA